MGSRVWETLGLLSSSPQPPPSFLPALPSPILDLWQANSGRRSLDKTKSLFLFLSSSLFPSGEHGTEEAKEGCAAPRPSSLLPGPWATSFRPALAPPGNPELGRARVSRSWATHEPISRRRFLSPCMTSDHPEDSCRCCSDLSGRYLGAGSNRANICALDGPQCGSIAAVATIAPMSSPPDF